MSKKNKSIRQDDPQKEREAMFYEKPLPSRELILKIMADQGVPLSISKLNELLEIADDESEAFNKRIRAMERQGQIMRNRKDDFCISEKLNLIPGRIQGHADGFGFLIPDQGGDDIFLSSREMMQVLHNDRVMVQTIGQDRKGRPEGKVIEILERKNETLVGRVVQGQGVTIVAAEDKRINQDFLIPYHLDMGAKPGQIVVIEITAQPSFKSRPMGKVIQILGNYADSGMEIEIALRKHQLPYNFSEETVRIAESFSKKVSENDFKGRVDLRDLPLITIDGETARDFDDAVYAESVDKNWRLVVAIADVSFYVQPDNALDKEAFERGTSVYLPGRVVPMLPFNLSNGVCSLVPNQDRLTVSCDMEINKQGKVVKYEIYPSVIKSYKRMTYTKVNNIFKGDVDLNEEYVDLVEMFYDMRNLAKALNKRRAAKGSINFETDEAYIILDDHGKAVDIKLRERGVSENIIEEFMLKANQVVAEHVFWMDLPFIYRVHDKPKAEKLEKLLRMSAALGYQVKAKTEITNFELQKLLTSVEGTPAEKGVNLLTLRSMQKAIYSEMNLGHYGLAFKYYSHFTSPIRRYPDLIVHRLLREYLFMEKKSLDVIDYYEANMPSIARQASSTERNAVMLEREVSDMKKAEYISKFINKEFDGIISSVTSFGLYIALPNTVEGLVHITALDDDYYNYDENLMTLIGERRKKVYRIGDDVRIRVTGANIIDGEVDFKIVK